jgi:hypothetical protein
MTERELDDIEKILLALNSAITYLYGIHKYNDRFSSKTKDALLALVSENTCQVDGLLSKSREKCKHYDRVEVNLVVDGKTAPVVFCKTCGRVLMND